MVHVPIAGNVPGPVVVVAVVGGMGGLGYAWWRNKKKQAATAASSPVDTTGTDTTGTDTSAYGTDNPYDYGAYTYDPYGGGGAGGYGDPGGYNAGTPVPSAPTTETNAQWTESVVTALTSNGAFDQNTVLASLGVYLTGGTLTADQQRVVDAAIAADGWPPVAGPGNYPPNMHTSPPTGQPATGKVAVPGVTGKNFGQAYNTLTKAGLISVPGHNGTHAGWKVTAQTPKAGTQVNKGTVVTLTVPQPK
jgi:hypothetical protein